MENEKNVTEEQAKEVLLNQPVQKPDLGYIDLSKPKMSMPDIGWIPMPINVLPSKGRFYDENIKINIKAASKEEIRHYSTMDDSDPIDIDEKLNFILDKCCNLSINERKASFKDLINVDRLFLVYSIRDLTFKDGENKLKMSIHCLNCGHEDSIEITRDKLSFFEYDSRLDNYYNEAERCFTLTTKKGESWNVYIPTIGINQFIKNYSRAKMQVNQIPDKFFLIHGSFLFKDWRVLNERSYKDAESLSHGWSQDKIDIMNGLVVMLESSVDSLIRHECSNCGADVVAPLSFQNGFKSLFLNTDIFSKLG